MAQPTAGGETHPTTSVFQEAGQDEQQSQQFSINLDGDDEASSRSSIPSLGDEAHTDEAIAPALPDPNTQMPKTHRKLSKFTIQDWWWGILSWAIGTSSLLCLVLLLALFDDKPTHAWKSKLSINTIVSALAQTAQSSLAVSLGSGISQSKWDWLRTIRQKNDIETFDEASRGPLGSLLLIWEQVFKGRRFPFVLIGALATALLVAFSSFAQQAVGVGERKVQSTIGAKIARANNYTQPPGENKGPEIVHGAMDALSRSDISYSEVQGECPGEECLWESYKSLGICVYTDQRAVNLTFSCNTNYSSCALVSPKYPGYNETDIQTIAQEMYGKPLGFQMWSPDPVLDTPDTPDSVDIYFTLSNSPNSYGNVTLSDYPLTFFKVTFELCIHTYRTTIQGTETNTTLLHQGPALTKDPDWRWTPDLGLPNYIKCGRADDVSACLSSSNFYDSTILLRYLSQDLLNGDRNEDDPIILLLYEDFVKPNGSDQTAARMKDMAVSLTNGMRRSPHSAEMVDGIAENSEAYFRIQIPWLILPITLWLLTSVFLLATMLLTTWHAVPIWKASPLVLLDCERPEANLESDHLVRKQAKQDATMVVLKETDGWWSLDER